MKKIHVSITPVQTCTLTLPLPVAYRMREFDMADMLSIQAWSKNVKFL